jgi:predicted RecA/RadA family phage recombinase
MTTYDESNGQAVNVSVTNTIGKGDIVYAEGWLGIAAEDVESGDSVALSIGREEYQFYVPSGLDVNKGDTVYITLASVTAEVAPDAAYSKTSGEGKKALFKATADQALSADGETYYAPGILLPEGV